MNNPDPDADPLSAGDDIVAAFQIEDEPVRGRVVRLGPATVDAILRRHAYPDPVSALVGEALALVALVGSSLKFEGKLIMQAQGDGPVKFVVAEYRSPGAVRAYAHIEPDALAALMAERPGEDFSAVELLGAGHFAMTIDQGEDTDRYQGLVALEGPSLSDCAELYFEQSEQVPTRIKLAVGLVHMEGRSPEWRAGGALIQRIAGDSNRGDTDDAWETASVLFSTIEAEELVDPSLAAGELLFRLYHEDGVRLHEAEPLEAACTCTRERIVTLLKQFGSDTADMIEPNGAIRVRCEYCNTSFEVAPDELT